MDTIRSLGAVESNLISSYGSIMKKKSQQANSNLSYNDTAQWVIHKNNYSMENQYYK